MKNAEAKTLAQGDKVVFLGDREAVVYAVNKNGIRIGYWGCGLKRGQYVITRAAARQLERA